MDENQMPKKWIKIVFAAVFVFCLTIIGPVDRTTENIETDQTTNENEFAVPQPDDAFITAVQDLKIQAELANSISGWPEKGAAINEIGEMLKNMLESEYADQLTNDTFPGTDFNVEFQEYPLKNSSIRKITYTLRDNKNDNPGTVSRFFLQYNGETSFFSDIEYMYASENTTDRRIFEVFESDDGGFVFFISSGYEYNTFASKNEKLLGYSVTVYIPEEQSFTVKRDVELPLKIASHWNLKLVQDQQAIKAIITNNQSTAEILFNSDELAFELPYTSLKSAPVDFEMPGLLLGLSDTGGNIRTLFIRKEADKIHADEYRGQIVISQQNSLFAVKRYLQYEDYFEDDFDNESPIRTGNLDVKKLGYGPLGADLTDDFERIFKSHSFWGYYAVTDIPLYIGEEYVCYIQSSYETGGGTFKASTASIRFDKLGTLMDYTLDGWLTPNFEEIKIAELIYGSKAQTLYKEDFSTYGGKLQPSIDFRHLSIKRNLGKWSLMLPIAEEYYHPGNGSYSKYFSAFAAYDNDVPDFLTTNEQMIEVGGWNSWDAKDIFQFPDSPAVLCQRDYYIEIWNNEDLSELVLSVPVNFDEYIVSINFADDTAIEEEWTRALKELN